jgi:hypothetical protein
MAMRPERWQQLDQLFHSALEREPSERSAFLDEACGGDESLHKQVEALLAANKEAGSFIERPAMIRRTWSRDKLSAITRLSRRWARVGWATSIWRRTRF